jgi:hypothetical protein
MSELPVDASPLPSDLASSFPSQIGWDCYPFTDTGNAQRLIKRHGKKLRYCKAWKTWLTWDGRRWKRDETGAVLRYAKHTARAMFRDASKINDSGKSDKAMKHARQSENEAKIRAMVSLASTEPGVPVAPEELDASPYLLTDIDQKISLQILLPLSMIPTHNARYLRGFWGRLWGVMRSW